MAKKKAAAKVQTEHVPLTQMNSELEQLVLACVGLRGTLDRAKSEKVAAVKFSGSDNLVKALGLIGDFQTRLSDSLDKALAAKK